MVAMKVAMVRIIHDADLLGDSDDGDGGSDSVGGGNEDDNDDGDADADDDNDGGAVVTGCVSHSALLLGSIRTNFP